MKKFFLIGNDIQKSLSPKIHNVIYREYGIKASYDLFQIKNVDEIKNLTNVSDGFNVTAPFKSQIISFLTNLNLDIDSVNTVTVTMNGKKLTGYSTDGKGFILDAIRLGLNLERVFIVGTGGAAKSIVHELKKIGIGFSVYNKQNDIKKEIKKIKPTLIINATPAKFYLDNIYDLKYNDYEGMSGIGMLIYQAILSAEIFLNIKIDLKIFSKIIGELNEN